MAATELIKPAFPPFDLESAQRELIDRVSTLAREKFVPRAAQYDRTATFPEEDFEDLFRAGLLAPAVPQKYGGLGLGPYTDDVFTLWMMTKEIAKVDLSLARCWEGHVNSLVLLEGMTSEEQKVRWFRGVVELGEKWVAWSGEPQAPKPGEPVRFGTRVEKVEGGHVINGNKVFATSAGGAQWAILLVNTAGPGGVRHATEATSSDTQLMMACNLSDPTVEIDTTWWDPIGMRATASHLVRFHDTFIPDSDLIGYPGQYLKEGWQTCFIPHYAATFLGAAEAAYDYGLQYVTTQNKVADPYVQHHIGQMSMNVETGYLWLRHVARLWETRRYAEAQIAGSRARHVVEHLAEDTVKHCIRACGARSLIRPSVLERIYRDLSFYVRHDNDDHILAMIGKSVMGLAHDPSFYKP
jgi:alkylation response protein AidB-like acyl-CoA dehydrogenase